MVHMPVRIYEIAKKLGVENKIVLAKAKDMGITNAKTPSSSVDKITAEYLEKELAAKNTPAKEEAPAKDKNESKSGPKLIAKTETEEPAEKSEDLKEDENKDAPEKKEEEEKPKEESGKKKTAIGQKIGFIQLKPGATRQRPEKRKKDKAGKKPGGAPERGQQGGGQGNNDRNRDRDSRGGGNRDKDFRGGGNRGDRDNRGGRGQGGDQGRGRPDRGQDNKSRQANKKPKFVAPADAPLLTMKPPIMVRTLAEKLNLKPFQLISDLMQLGVFANVSQSIEEEIAIQVCAKHNVRFEVEKRDKSKGFVPTKKKVVLDKEDKEEDLKHRAPVITIMGHVDHGKTTLLDYIRKSNVVSGEDGGITQHIGAYTIEVPNPENEKDIKQITFLDTPGHAAFSAMRARGADVTDIVILVCAADDGIMPQTKEALNHAKAADVPIIIAVNKCDAPNANSQKVRQEFQGLGLAPEEWGGETIFVDVSALKGDGVPELLTMILLQAEIMELKANPNRSAVGNVVESGVEQGGPTATVLVRKGTLKTGDVMVCGTYWGKVRALIGHDGSRLKSAGPSSAVKVLGLNGAPDAGTEFNIVKKEREARNLVEERELKQKSDNEVARKKKTLESFFQQMKTSEEKILNLILKSDTQGSLEAIVDSLEKIDSNKASVKMVHTAVGSITESDILLASTSEAIVLGFHTRLDSGATSLAKREGVQIKQYTIIYELMDDVEDALTGLLEPELKEVVTGAAEVRQVFNLSKGGAVAGCYVRDGKFTKGKVRVLRDGEKIHEGTTSSLRRFQDEVNEIRNGMECGIRISDFAEYQEGDILESFIIEKVASKL